VSLQLTETWSGDHGPRARMFGDGAATAQRRRGKIV
jgi:hypothetical protein